MSASWRRRVIFVITALSVFVTMAFLAGTISVSETGKKKGPKRIVKDFSKEPVDKQMKNIRKTLKNLIEMRDTCQSPTDSSSCLSRAGGMLWWVEKDPIVEEMTLHREPFGDYRLLSGRSSNEITELIHETLKQSEQLQEYLAKGRTILYQGLEDHDIFYHVRMNASSPLSNAIMEFVKKHPNMYWLHWNPTFLDEQKGLLGPRVVPIPHFEGLVKDYEGKADPVDQRTPDIAWRGATTGFFNPYTKSDRFRVVKAFDGVAGSDVKFSNRVQGVDNDVVPDSLMGGGMNEMKFANRRVVLDIDGNANAWEGLRWKLRLGATIVKAKSIYYAQWYYPRMSHGKELWVADIDNIVAEAQKVAKDTKLAQRLADNAYRFGQRHLTSDAIRNDIPKILGEVKTYAKSTDWRIRPFDEFELVPVQQS